MKIGVFDSGIGGRAIAESLRHKFTEAEILVVDDHANLPYGEKSPKDIINLTEDAIQPLISANCDVIVIACNTATAIAIETLRHKYTNQNFVGIEPMIKSAAQLTKSSIITVCATPATLSSARYKNLVKKYGSHLEIIEPDCSKWAYLIERNQINKKHIESALEYSLMRKSDVIVLGCTHYHWIKQLIIATTKNKALILEPSMAISDRVENVFKSS